MHTPTDQLVQTITTHDTRLSTVHYFSIALFIGIVAATTVFSYTKLHSDRVSLTIEESTNSNNANNAQKELPVSGVAGASTSSNNTQGFDTVSATISAPALGNIGTCTPGELFSIGDKEQSKSDNPADEFNWVGALDVTPDYVNPFVVGVNKTTDFPWRTDSTQPDTLQTKIVFNYAGSAAQAELVLAWSPGKQGDKQKEVFIDNLSLGKTDLHSGYFDETSWEFMPLVQDTFSFTLTPGEHTLIITSLSRSSGESIWDYLNLTVDSCM